jgi:FixJ family two-component response regulator
MSLGMHSQSTVYLIEDDPVQRDSLESLIQACGYTTSSFASSEAFHRRPQTERTPGCILLDFLLGGQDGLSFLRKHNQQNDAMPVIVLTGHADVSIAVNFMKAGASTLLVKPFDANELFHCIERLIAWDQSTLDARLKAKHVQMCLERLSERQKKIKNLVLMGSPNKVVASQLQLSERTIELERAEILKLFAVKNAVELAVLVTESQHPIPPITLRIDPPPPIGLGTSKPMLPTTEAHFDSFPRKLLNPPEHKD